MTLTETRYKVSHKVVCASGHSTSIARALVQAMEYLVYDIPEDCIITSTAVEHMYDGHSNDVTLSLHYIKVEEL